MKKNREINYQKFISKKYGVTDSLGWFIRTNHTLLVYLAFNVVEKSIH